MSSFREINTGMSLIMYLIQKINSTAPRKKIGKTSIQKLIYFLTREGVVNYNYNLYYYGPYANEVSNIIDLSEMSNKLKVTWNQDYGYSIKVNDKIKRIDLGELNSKKRIIDKTIDKYKDFSATDLSLIATAYYLMDNQKVVRRDLPNKVNEIKPNYDIKRINYVLKKAEVIQ